MKSALVLHAYSSHNRGDGWLVTLTHDLLKDADYRPFEITTFALEPSTFERGFAGNFKASARKPNRVPSSFQQVLQAASSVATGLTSVRREIAAADLIVGVGGGYLRSGDRAEGFRTLFAHGPQLFAAGSGRARTVYLPQSIGPLKGFAGALLRRGVGRLDRVFVRDDTSMGEIAGATRMPDLAALHVGKLDPRVVVGGETVLSVRDVRNRDAHKALHELNQILSPSILGVQSIGGNNEDRPLTESISLPGQEVLPMAEAAERAGVVVAVRLHAAVSAIARGIPTIHLSYERKGWGVFSDLGLSEWVHDVRTFDPASVAAQAKELAEDRTRYWQCLSEAAALLRGQREELVNVLRGDAASTSG